MVRHIAGISIQGDRSAEVRNITDSGTHEKRSLVILPNAGFGTQGEELAVVKQRNAVLGKKGERTAMAKRNNGFGTQRGETVRSNARFHNQGEISDVA